MSRRGELDVIVVGAGVVGAATALALARDGSEVALVEARAPQRWQRDDDVDARVVALAPDTIELFHDLDLWSTIVGARASAYQRMCVWDALAPGELVFDSRADGEAALGWIVENRLLQDTLWTAVHDDRSGAAAVRVLCPHTIEQLDDDVDGVSALLDDGTRLRARLLVAADGTDSAMRTRLGIATHDRDYDQRAIVAHVGTERAHEATAWQRFQPGGPLALLPLADGRSSIVWSLPNAEAMRVLALDDASFMDELGCAADFRLGAITSTTARLSFPLRLRLAQHYVKGRCALMGDAAHGVHPLAGQGLNLGLRDLRCLRAQLHDARQRGSDIGAPHVLRRYERERRSENTLAARGLDLIERVFTADSMPLALLRGAALGLVNQNGPLKSVLARSAAGRL